MSIEKLNEIAAEIDASKKKLAAFAQTEGKSAIGAAFAKCFEPPTNLVRIEWTQYVPGFNDGDACLFTVSEPELFADVDGEEKEFDSYSLDDADAKAAIGQKSLDAFDAAWSIPEEILQAVFGENVKVVITADDVEVEEYDCGY